MSRRLVVAAVGVAVLVVPAGAARSAPPAVTCNGLKATIVGTKHHDLLVGTSGRDVIAGLGGHDRIEGRGGADVICGASQQAPFDNAPDVLSGGRGDDVIVAVSGRDVIVGGAGDDTMRYADFPVLDYSASPHPVSVDLRHDRASGWGHDTFLHPAGAGVTLLGSAYADTLVGGSEPDAVYGREGDDTINTHGGMDTVTERGTVSGDDTISLGRGEDYASLTSGSDTVDGGSGGGDISVDAGTGSRGPVTVTRGAHVSITGLVDGDHVADLSQGVLFYLQDGGALSLDLPGGALHLGALTATASGVSDWQVYTSSDATVTGSDGPEQVGIATTLPASAPSPVLVAHLGGGDDRFFPIDFDASTIDLGEGDDYLDATTDGSSIDGGAGTDEAHVDGSGNSCVNVESGC